MKALDYSTSIIESLPYGSLLEEFTLYTGSIKEAFAYMAEDAVSADSALVDRLSEDDMILSYDNWKKENPHILEKGGLMVYLDYAADYVRDCLLPSYLLQALCYYFFSDFFMDEEGEYEVKEEEFKKVEEIASHYTIDDTIEDFMWEAWKVFGVSASYSSAFL